MKARTLLRCLVLYLIHVPALSFLVTAVFVITLVFLALVLRLLPLEFGEFAINSASLVIGGLLGFVAKRVYGRLPFLPAVALAVWWLSILDLFHPWIPVCGMLIGFLQPFGKRRRPLFDCSMPWMGANPLVGALLLTVSILFCGASIRFLDRFHPTSGGVMHSQGIVCMIRAHRSAWAADYANAGNSGEPVFLKDHLLAESSMHPMRFYVRKGPLDLSLPANEIMIVNTREFANIHNRNFFKTAGYAVLRAGGGIDFIPPEEFQTMEFTDFEVVKRE